MKRLALALCLAFAAGLGAAPPGAGQPLVGTWQDRAGGRVEFLADGTGKNANGSRFTWTLADDTLTATALSPEGKPIGEPFRVPISFTRDGKEHAIELQGGTLEVVRDRLGPDRRVEEFRTPEGRVYVSGPKARKGMAPVKPGLEELPTLPAYHDPALPGPGAVAVTVGPNAQVSLARAAVPHWEVILAADPTDPGRLLAGSMLNPPPVNYGVPKTVVYASADGGKTWGPTLERRGGASDVFADPELVLGAGGAAWYVNLSGPSLGSTEGALEIFASRDSGRTWGAPARVAGWRDRPFLAVDRTAGPFAGRLYCATADGVFASADGGKTFGRPSSWARRKSYVSVGTGNAAVLSDGALVALYNGHLERPAAGKPDTYLAVRVSRDGGASFGDERVVGEGTIGVPSILAADATVGPRRDWLYAVWPELVAGGGFRVRFARSADRGASWSPRSC